MQAGLDTANCFRVDPRFFYILDEVGLTQVW